MLKKSYRFVIILGVLSFFAAAVNAVEVSTSVTINSEATNAPYLNQDITLPPQAL